MKTPEPEFITVGRIAATSGINGKVKVIPETDFPQRFTRNATVYINRQPFTIESAEGRGEKLVLKFRSINSIEEAGKLRGKVLEINRSQVNPLPEGEYYHFQLIGLEVRTVRGEVLGEITGILPTGSNDNYAVRREKGEILVPAIGDVVKSVDLEERVMVIEPMEGLLDLNR